MATAYIQVWVDTNAVQTGSTAGIYLVDNRTDEPGSQPSSEGTATLTTGVPQGSKVYWSIYNIDPTSTLPKPKLNAIGSSPVWGSAGQPENDGTGVFVGTAAAAGTDSYSIDLIVTQTGGSLVQCTVNPSISVQ
ncbi:MAG TPA: hypothetical protein VGC56_17265 [Allosphingosinicella sp.]|jgi:hypothetical protein